MRLLVDVMCGRILAYCRLCGHDAVYALDRDAEEDESVVEIAEREGRTVVTRDVALADRASDSILLESRDVDEQLRELAAAGVPLTPTPIPERCGRCNGLLVRVGSTESTPAYAPDPAETPTWRCLECGQYFWKGSHWDRMAETLARSRRDANGR